MRGARSVRIIRGDKRLKSRNIRTNIGDSLVSFTFTGPSPISPGLNSYPIIVSGIPNIYVAGELVSIEYNIAYPDLSELESYASWTGGLGGSMQTLFSQPNGGATLSGADLTSTIFYNSNLASNPSIESSSAPYTGTWTDVYDDGTFDDAVGTAGMNSNWEIVIFNTGLSVGNVTSIILTFNP